MQTVSGPGPVLKFDSSICVIICSIRMKVGEARVPDVVVANTRGDTGSSDATFRTRPDGVIWTL